MVLTDVLLKFFTVFHMQNFGPQHYSAAYFLRVAFESWQDGLLILLLLFWGIVHSWSLGWCELMRFADRHYYNVRCFTLNSHLDLIAGLVEFASHVKLLS